MILFTLKRMIRQRDEMNDFFVEQTDLYETNATLPSDFLVLTFLVLNIILFFSTSPLGVGTVLNMVLKGYPLKAKIAPKN